jgi:hypothetical protein
MALKVSLEGTDIEAAFKASAARNYGRVADSIRATANRAKEQIETEWAADVANAGNFGERWVEALKVQLDPPSGRTTNITMTIRMEGIPYWRVHEYGAEIKGKPLLWIPLPWTGLMMRAREYGRRFGLFRVEREGKNPLLFSIRDKQPKYVGVESVKLRKRFHLHQIIRRAGRSLKTLYRSEYRRRSGR